MEVVLWEDPEHNHQYLTFFFLAHYQRFLKIPLKSGYNFSSYFGQPQPHHQDVLLRVHQLMDDLEDLETPVSVHHIELMLIRYSQTNLSV